MIKSLADIHQAEREKWDALAPADVLPEHIFPEGVTFATVANDNPLLSGVTDFLGDLRGKRVLEYGCGLGQFTVLLARSGAHVTAFDLSAQTVDYVQRRAAANGVADRIETHVAAAESLPFDNEAFDIVFGKAILHHIDTDSGAPELRRVVKPGGKAAFSEPLGMNPLLNFAREYLPYPHKHTRGEDHPLKKRDIVTWTEGFRETEIRGIQLLSMVERGFGFNRSFSWLRRADRLLLKHFPGLTCYCRYAVLLMTK